MVKQAALTAAQGVSFHPDDLLRIAYWHDVGMDCLGVIVEKIGEMPAKGKRGTKRDVHGMLETIADALQGVLYDDDSAVDAFEGKRVRPSQLGRG